MDKKFTVRADRMRHPVTSRMIIESTPQGRSWLFERIEAEMALDQKQKSQFEEQLVPAKRCPGFSSDCADVANHHHCHLGHLAATLENGITVDALIEADGYCPYLNGMLPR